MANVTVDFGGTRFDLTKGKLVHFLEDPLNPRRVFALTEAGGGTFAEMTQDCVVKKIALDQNGSWKVPGQANLKFKLAAGGSAELRIRKSGELFRYKLDDTEEDAKPEVVQCDADRAYVSLVFHFSFEVTGNASFSFPNGFGVSAEASRDRTFSYEMHRAFSPDQPISDSVLSMFEDVVLPFQVDELDTLRDGDYVRWDFAGKLHVGVGAEWSVDKVLLGGNSPAEVVASLQNQTLAKLSVKDKPTVSAGAKFAVTYDHSDEFSILLHRSSQQDRQNLSLLLFTTERRDLGVSFTPGVYFDPATKVDFSTALDTLVHDKLFGRLGVPGASALGDQLQGTLDSIDGKKQVQELVTDVNHQIGSLKQGIEAKISENRIHRDTALFHYHFDLGVTEACHQGYPLAMQGLWDQALTVPGVTLERGTIFENEFTVATAVSFHFFDVFRCSDTAEYFEKSQVVYTGNQTLRFHLETEVGRRGESGVVGHAGHVDMYFAAAASTDDFQHVSDTEVRLHCKLLDHANREKALQTAAFLSNAGPATAAAGEQLRQLATKNPNLDVDLEAILFPTAFENLSVSEYQGTKPSPAPHTADKRNWDAFLSAVNTVFGASGRQFPAFLADFDKFERLQIAAVDQPGGPGPGDRRSEGNQNSIPPSEYHNDKIALLWMETARQFLNLCDDLKHLPEATLANTGAQFQDLIERLKVIAREDIPGAWFTKPALLALLRLMNGTVTLTKAPDPAVTNCEKFAVSFEVH